MNEKTNQVVGDFIHYIGNDLVEGKFIDIKKSRQIGLLFAAAGDIIRYMEKPNFGKYANNYDIEKLDELCLIYGPEIKEKLISAIDGSISMEELINILIEKSK
nr:hypothetical protein [uncultured Pedobacter sp.]